MNSGATVACIMLALCRWDIRGSHRLTFDDVCHALGVGRLVVGPPETLPPKVAPEETLQVLVYLLVDLLK